MTKITVEGTDLQFGEILQTAEDSGGVVHSIDEAVAGKVLVEDSPTAQDATMFGQSLAGVGPNACAASRQSACRGPWCAASPLADPPRGQNPAPPAPEKCRPPGEIRRR
jgi:hypothetical protein